MRSLAGRMPLIATLFLAALAFAPDALAQGMKPVASPTASPTPQPDEVSIGDDDLDAEEPVVPPKPPDDHWDERSGGRTYLAGIRGGYHAFDFAAGGGFAFEATVATPVRGPFYAALVFGYHTGFHDVNDELSFFDAEFGAIEGQYRMNMGKLNLFTGLGLGFLSGNSAEVVRADGLAGDSGSGPLAHVVAGVYYPIGRVGLVTQVKYGIAPVNFAKVDKTLSMGGLTAGVGFDFGF